jgi:hypothetical protein
MTLDRAASNEYRDGAGSISRDAPRFALTELLENVLDYRYAFISVFRAVFLAFDLCRFGCAGLFRRYADSGSGKQTARWARFPKYRTHSTFRTLR